MADGLAAQQHCLGVVTPPISSCVPIACPCRGIQEGCGGFEHLSPAWGRQGVGDGLIAVEVLGLVLPEGAQY